MGALLLAEFKNKREAELVAQLIETMGEAKVLQKGKNVEDMYFAEMINEGLNEKGSVSLANIKLQLNKKIAKNIS
jgi:hypothetical protein